MIKLIDILKEVGDSSSRLHINKHIKLFENDISGDKLKMLKDHLNRTNIDLAKWIVNNLDIEHKGKLTNKAAVEIVGKVNDKRYWSKLPTMYFFSEAEDVPDNTILMHFTTSPEKIAQNGFTKGEPNYLKLGMNWGEYSSKAGYNYAFLPETVIEKYGSLESAKNVWLYGGEKGGIVFFKARSIKAYHFGDEIEQVIFWGPDAHDITPALRKNKKWIYDNTTFETLDDVYNAISAS